jgi:nicotinamidase-related amidase
VAEAGALLIVDVQNGFLNAFTQHIPDRIATLIARDSPAPVLFTRFVNSKDGPYHRFLDWRACQRKPQTCIAAALQPFVQEDLVFAKPGLAGMPDELKLYLVEQKIERISIVGIDTDMCVLKVALDIFDLGIEPIVLVDCCASTSGLQAHLAGLAVLARNIGADRLRGAGLSDGRLAAPPEQD